MKLTVTITIFFLISVASIVCANEDFLVLEATNYTKKPNLAEHGINTIPIVYAGDIFKHGADRSEMPALQSIRKAADKYRDFEFQSNFLVLDIESWPVYKASSDVAAISVEKYIKTLDLFKLFYQRDDIKVGYYSVGPVRDYWRAIKKKDHSEYLEWVEENSMLIPLMRQVDVLYPSLYTFYDDVNGWEEYAIENIKEARRIAKGKPVICFIWPRYHDSYKLLAGKFIPGDYWRAQLELLYEYADGVVIWDGARDEWSNQLEWIRVTREFIEHNKL